MANLSLSSVRKTFGAHEVIRGVDLEIGHGEFVVFVGPSGCGKSTMLRMISGLEDVTAGAIRIDGLDVTRAAPSKREIAMVFQSYALFPHMTVAQNIGFGLRLNGVDKASIRNRVAQVAEILQIQDLLERTPRELSGGQRQRVAIGRAIIRDPKIFLFDEPLSNLDAALRVQMRLEIARLHARLGATMIYVTHDQTEAMTLADRIVVFNGGRIEQVGAPMELYERPANLFVAGFIGAPAMNLMEGVVTHGGLSLASRHRIMPGKWAADGAVTVGVRPEHIRVATPGEGDLDGRIEIVERLGAEVYAYVQTRGSSGLVTLRLPGSTPLRTGDEVAMALEPDRIHVFGRDGLSIGVEV
jgi:ABC-type sugar transport system ATPase subunit